MSGPLDGVRIADLGIITAGAASTQILADFGADVIKVEGPTYIDPFRHWQTGRGDPAREHLPRWETSPPFQVVNRNKRGVSLDLRDPRGKAAFLRLVSQCDVVLENFRRGALERLGLGFDVLRSARPDVILVSCASQGCTGPERGYISYGSTLDALGGLMAATGYDPETPTWSGNGVNYPDQVVSLFAAGVTVAALRLRQLTGRALHVDLSQRELVTYLVGEMVLDYAVNGEVSTPRGNQHPAMAPHGCFPCLGADAWVAITVETDDQWRALCQVMGRSDLGQDPRYATLSERLQRGNEIEHVVGNWTRGIDKHVAMRILQSAGVPAAAVLNGKDLLVDPQLAVRGFYSRVEHSVAGPQMQRSSPMRLSTMAASTHRPAPRLGEHTREVLTCLLGYTDAEVSALEEGGVIGYAPSSVTGAG